MFFGGARRRKRKGAIKRNSQQQIQTLSFNEYYTRFGTTEERDGWKMANPTGQKVIYVKQKN